MRSFLKSSLFHTQKSSFSTSKPARLNHLHIPAKEGSKSPLNLVVLHGLLGSAPNFRGIVNNAKISSHANSYLLDLRNHGASEHRDTMTSPEMAEDVHTFIKEHNLSDNLVIMGHSMGARVSMTFCSMFPEVLKAAIIVDFAPYDYRSDPRFSSMQETQALLEDLVKIDMDQDYKKITEEIRAAAKQKTIAEFVMTNLRKDDVSGFYRWKSNLPAILKSYQRMLGAPEGMKEANKHFTGPLKIIFGGDSNYYKEDIVPKFTQIFPKFNKEKDLSIIPGAGHWVHFAKPVEFIEEVSRFLIQVKEGGH